jgi:MEMO1 family protein
MCDMAKAQENELPRLRSLDPQPIWQDGRQLLLLRDPLQMSDRMVAIPFELAPLLLLCDGTRDSGDLRASLLVRFGLQVSPQIVDRFLAVCDEALLLKNSHFLAAQAETLAAYRAAPYRPPALAGSSYPGDPDRLAQLFEDYLAAPAARRLGEPAGRKYSGGSATGIISPHIDYQRGGPVYAAVWGAATDIVRAADLAVLFGTDHYGGAGEITLTRQSYATPWGVLPTPADLVDALARAIGPERAFASELHHRNEHSIELAVTWLHYVRRDLAPLPVVPILCGSFHHFVAGEARPESDPAIGAMVQALAEGTAGRRILVVAGADLAHVGPAFGGLPQGPAECSQVHAADQALMDQSCAADAGGFFASVKQVGDRYNVCGLPPIYMALRTLALLGGIAADAGPDDATIPVADELPRLAGHVLAYDNCPADNDGTSFVSITGIILE